MADEWTDERTEVWTSGRTMSAAVPVYRAAAPAPLAEPEHRDVAVSYLIGYSVLIPVISALGVVGNTLNLLVLTHGRRHMKHSIYVYFTFLSMADLITCILVLFSGIAKGVAANSVWWQLFDVYLHLGCGAVSTTASITTTVMVTVERLITISSARLARWYCTRKMAWRVCRIITGVSIAFNIPYFLPFSVHAEHGIRPTKFYYSRYYQAHNWVRFVVLGVGAAVFLSVGNAILMLSFRRSCARRRTLLSQQKHWEERRLKEHSRLTATLIGIIVMFLLGEFPTHLASRQSSLTLLFSGDTSKLDSPEYHRLKLCASVLMAINYSCNFILYCALNSHFATMLCCVLRCRKPETPETRRRRRSRLARAPSNGAPASAAAAAAAAAAGRQLSPAERRLSPTAHEQRLSPPAAERRRFSPAVARCIQRWLNGPRTEHERLNGSPAALDRRNGSPDGLESWDEPPTGLVRLQGRPPTGLERLNEPPGGLDRLHRRPPTGLERLNGPPGGLDRLYGRLPTGLESLNEPLIGRERLNGGPPTGLERLNGQTGGLDPRIGALLGLDWLTRGNPPDVDRSDRIPSELDPLDRPPREEDGLDGLDREPPEIDWIDGPTNEVDGLDGLHSERDGLEREPSDVDWIDRPTVGLDGLDGVPSEAGKIDEARFEDWINGAPTERDGLNDAVSETNELKAALGEADVLDETLSESEWPDRDPSEVDELDEALRDSDRLDETLGESDRLDGVLNEMDDMHDPLGESDRMDGMGEEPYQEGVNIRMQDIISVGREVLHVLGPVLKDVL